MFEIEESVELMLSHVLVPAGPIPTAYDPDGVYPYETYVETSRRPVVKKYRMVTIANDRIRVKICPDLGGKVCSIFLREAGLETLFNPHVVRPVRILPRNAFIGGGVEVSFPISHTPIQLVSVLYEVRRAGNRVYVSCGEKELRFGMHWTVEYSLGEADAFLTQRTVFHNPGRSGHPWMSWSNAAVPARPDTEFHFPCGPVLAHGSDIRTIDWRSEGPRCQRDIQRMTGYFWLEPDCCAFGAFTPSVGAGLYHVADAALTPGMKLWSDGVGRDEPWVSQYTLDGDQCVEIQAGPLVDQSIKWVLEPGSTHHHTEFWIPSSTPLDIHSIELPDANLRNLDEVPRFGWARGEEVSYWVAVVSVWESDDATRLPAALDVGDNRWAVSGMAELGEALRWASEAGPPAARGRWLFQLGAWLGGRGELAAALDVLTASRDDRALALAGRLWRHVGKPSTAAQCFRDIRDKALALHPQVVVERDKCLAALGRETLRERARWLDAVSALDDEWIIERRAALLLDSGNPQGALELLRNARFQLVHQRYARTRLWRQAERHLGVPPAAYPNWLGEDDLAEFGAYSEYKEA